MQNKKNKKKSLILLIGIMMMGAVMRVPFTAIPAVLTDVAAGLDVPVSDLGILTSLPLIMFAIFSNLAPRWAARFGLERFLGLALIIMALGSFIRITNLAGLYLGTLLIGVAIAAINVLLPSLVSVHFPLKVGTYTTIYITMMGIASTVGSMIAVPIVAATSWQSLIIFLSILVTVTALVWLPNWSYHHPIQEKVKENQQTSLWKNKAALAFLLFSGLQSTLFYTVMTWLPTIAQTAGLSKAEGGLIAGTFSMLSIPISLFIPTIISRLNNKQRASFMSALSLLLITGFIWMLFQPSSFVTWVLISAMLGLPISALFPYMMLSFTLKTSDGQATARLSGMVQSGGYLLASVGPVLLGYSFSLTGSWELFIFSLIAVTLLMILTIFAIEKEDIII